MMLVHQADILTPAELDVIHEAFVRPLMDAQSPEDRAEARYRLVDWMATEFPAHLLPEVEQLIRSHEPPEVRLEQRIEAAYESARSGDPGPLIELQWGQLVHASEVIADPLIVGDLRESGEPFVILDGFQRDVIWSVMDPSLKEVFVKGNTGCGKGGSSSIAICLYYATFDDAKVVLTRDSHRRAKAVMFGEVAKWWRKMRYAPPQCEVQSDRIIDSRSEQHVCEVVNPGSPEGFRGTHSPHVLFVFDEATARVLEKRFKIARTQTTKFLTLGNPDTTRGAYREAFFEAEDPDLTQTILTAYGRRRLITIGGQDCLNVRMKRLEQPLAPPGGIEIEGRRFDAGETIPPEWFRRVDPIIPGQTCYDTDLGHRADPDPDWVRTFADGKFPGENPDTQLILGYWVRHANESWKRYERMRRWLADKGPSCDRWVRREFGRIFRPEALGLDVGASRGGDPSVLTIGSRLGIFAQFAERLPDAEALADWVVETVTKRFGVDQRTLPIAVDADGVGWGMEAILRRKGMRVVVIHGNAAATEDPKRHSNLRTECWGELAKRLKPDGEWKGIPFMLPQSDLLQADLTAPEKVFDSSGIKFSITPKRPIPGVDKAQQKVTLVDKLGRSPDYGDSAAYFYRALTTIGGPTLAETLNSDLFW